MSKRKHTSMKRVIIYLFFFLIIAILSFFLYKSCTKNKDTEEVYVSHEMVVQQIEQLGRLEVVKYNIQDLMQYEKKRNWLPNSKITIKVVGEVTGCIDLAQLTPGDIIVNKDSVNVILPDPEICNYKVDHSKSRVFNVEYGLWETDKVVDEAYKQAEQNLYKQAQNMGIAKESKANAVKVMRPILQGLGFKRIHIGFKSDPNYTSQGQSIEIKKE